jgi:hypothetical protein
VTGLTPAQLKGRTVRFRLRDIHLPEPALVLDELFGRREVEGEVVDVSDSGIPGGAFVLVRVDAYRAPVTVSVDHLLRT